MPTSDHGPQRTGPAIARARDVSVVQVQSTEHVRALQVILRRYLHESELPHADEIVASVPGALASGTMAWVALDTDGLPVGCVALRPNGEFTRMYVVPEQRMAGLAHRLGRTALVAGGWWTTTSEHNDVATAALERNGLVPVGTKEPGYIMWIVPDLSSGWVL